MTYLKPLSSNEPFGLIVPKNYYFGIILPNFETAGFNCGHYKNSLLICNNDKTSLDKLLKTLSKKMDLQDSIFPKQTDKDLILILNNNILMYFNTNHDLNNYRLYNLSENYYFEKWRYNWIKPELKIEYLNKKIV
jgi:hypothetical protein